MGKIIVSFENVVNGNYLYFDKYIDIAFADIDCVSEVNKAFIVASSSQLNDYFENVLKDDIVCSDVFASVAFRNWPSKGVCEVDC
ncbi:hypothetical protein Csa_005530 [Cucumis sativus]|uniref:Uncharacterized protein n=1 Tax=Cucumis sativus TaxID=3659 RepID=A0A0A0K9A4_CUCSA|nr:hypothetical protein Csa_005530 [Cucumis sativus]